MVTSPRWWLSRSSRVRLAGDVLHRRRHRPGHPHHHRPDDDPHEPRELAGRQWNTRRKIATLFGGKGALIAAVIALCAVANMVDWQGLNVWATQAMVDLGY